MGVLNGALQNLFFRCPLEQHDPFIKQDVLERFSIRFYLLAILFLLFDVEAMFMFPWAVKYDALGLFGFVEMMLFIAILLVGYFYAWRKGALEWA